MDIIKRKPAHISPRATILYSKSFLDNYKIRCVIAISFMCHFLPATYTIKQRSWYTFADFYIHFRWRFCRYFSFYFLDIISCAKLAKSAGTTIVCFGFRTLFKKVNLNYFLKIFSFMQGIFFCLTPNFCLIPNFWRYQR